MFKKTKKSTKSYRVIGNNIDLSIAVTAFLATSNSRFNSEKLRAYNNNIPIIYKALEKYLLTNKKLPCPASLIEIKSSSTIYGLAASSRDCISTVVYKGTGSGAANLVYRMIPTQTLDSKLVEDAYGNKLFYIVDKRLTRKDVALNSFEGVIKNSTLIQVNNEAIELTYSALFIINNHTLTRYLNIFLKGFISNWASKSFLTIVKRHEK